MNINRKTHVFIILLLLQSVSIMVLSDNTIIQILHLQDIYNGYCTYIIIIMNLLGIIAIIYTHYIIKFIAKEDKHIEDFNNSKEIIKALQSQKHDFQNHLSIISGLIQLGKPEKALDYTFNICEKTNEIFSISKINNLEVAALLYNKYALAESKGISVELDIDSFLENIKISSIELCKILFNLIDNAIYALDHCNEEEKILSVQISQVEDNYVISIINSFPILDEELYDKIFQNGFSTKIGPEHGHGLPIVKNIVHKNNGSITIESYDGVGTIFTVFLPM